MKWPNSDSSSSPTGFSSETGDCAVRRICSTSSGGQIEVARDLDRVRLPSELGSELALGADDLVQLLDDVHGHADRPRLVRQRARDRLPDPPRGVGRELESLAVVELLRGADEPDRPLLDQIQEGQALIAVALGDRDDEPEVRLHHLLLRPVVAALDPLGQLDLLRGGQQVDAADVLEEELQGVGRHFLRLELLGNGIVLLLPGRDHLDLQLVEGLVEVVDLARVEVELVERERDLVRCQRARLPPRLEQAPGLLGLEHRHALAYDGRSAPAHCVTPPVKADKLAATWCSVKRPAKKAALLQTQRTDAWAEQAHLCPLARS